jgi:DNA-binding CsgD family transcriptional regulator
VLLERDTELGAVDTLLSRVRTGEGGIMIFEGSAGIGKTSLLRATRERAAAEGFDVLHARAGQLEHGFSFGVARQLMERRVRTADATERRMLLGGAAEDGLRPLGIADDHDDGDVGLRSLHGLYWLVANLASRQRLVLCIDDAHWADRSSLRWLVYTAQRLAGLPLAIVLTARAAEPGAEQDLLDALALDDAAQVLRPAPLSAEAVGVLVGTSLPGTAAPEFETACHHSTGGNPLLVHELLRELAAEGAEASAQRAERLPWFGVDAVTRNVRRRLDALGPQASAVACAVAVVGDGATVPEVAALCSLDEADVRAAVTDLVATEVLAADVQLTFVHPLVRAAVYDDITKVQRAHLHREVATLRDGRDDPERVAVHLLRADPRGDSHVVDVLCDAAAEAVGRGAPDAAARFLQRALAEPPELGAIRASVLVDLGQAEALARLDGFEEHLSAAIAELTDPEAAADVALMLGRGLFATGEWQRAFEVLEQALPTVDPQSPVGLLLEAEALAFAHTYAPLRPRVADRVDRYVERLDRGEPVDALVQGALSPTLLREHPPSARAVQAAEAALADERLTAAVNTIVLPAMAYTLLAAGDLRRAGELFDAVIADSRRRGSPLTLNWASSFRSDVSYRQGDIVKAEGEARVGWEIGVGDAGGVASTPLALNVSAAMLINALVARNELVEAQRCVDRLPDPLPERSEMLLAARGELRLAQGRTDEAIADFEAVGALLGEEFHKPIQNWRARLAIALAQTGAREQARALAAAELEQAERWDVPLAIGVALTAAGIADGGPDGVALLRQAVDVLASTDGRLDHAISLIELGALLRRTGSPTAAREPLRAGLDLAARCGATAHADRAHSELIAAGSRPRRDRRFLTGPESLTAGEFRVATLAADGLTNREIAQRLYVTQSAVQFHLGNIFRKLDVRARGELAGVLHPESAEPTAAKP